MNSMANNALALGIGIIITFLGLSIFLGDIGGAISLIVLSVVCTAGISLIIWIPLCWAIGWIILQILKLAGVFSPATNPVNTRIESHTMALINYIKQAKNHGLSDTQIATRLRTQGWTNEDIETAQRMANGG